MKLVSDSRTTDKLHVDRFTRALNHLLAKLRIRKATEAKSLREQHQALIESHSRYTPEERKEIRRRASTHPLTEEALTDGDAVWEEYQKGLEPGELRSRTSSPSNAHR